MAPPGFKCKFIAYVLELPDKSTFWETNTKHIYRMFTEKLSYEFSLESKVFSWGFVNNRVGNDDIEPITNLSTVANMCIANSWKVQI